MIPSIHTVSSPINTLNRLLYANQMFVNPYVLKPHGVRKEDLEFLIEHALVRQEDSRFIGVMNKYFWYMNDLSQDIRENPDTLQGREIVVLDVVNLQDKDKYGGYKRMVTDDFKSSTEVAKKMMHIYQDSSDAMREVMRSLIFWRISPYDFPFQIREENNIPHIINPFFEHHAYISAEFSRKGRTALGAYRREIDDIQTAPNYQGSVQGLSIEKFRESARLSNNESLEMSHQQYITRLNIDLSLEKYAKLCESAILLNREVLKHKYANIFTQLKQPVIHLYMLQGDVGTDIMDGVQKLSGIPTHVIGGKLLSDTKFKPQGGVLEPQALNKFVGWLNAYFHLGDDGPTIKTAPAEFPALPHQSVKYPYIIFNSEPSEVENFLDNTPKADRKLLERDIATYSFKIATIEEVIMRLNLENFPVFTDQNIEKSWQTIIAGHKVHPYYIRDIEETEIELKRHTRPSNSSSKCELQKYISTLPSNIFPPDIKPGEYSRSGTLIHTISDVEGSNQKEIFKEMNIAYLDRDEYCERPLLRRFKPSLHQWNTFQEKLEKEYRKTLDPFTQILLNYLDTLDTNATSINDAGSPDAVAFIDNPTTPVIIDFKRRVARAVPVESFFRQTTRYGLSVIENKKLECDTFYVCIVQTPFTQSKRLNKQIYDRGHYRKQVFRIREVHINSAFVEKTHEDIMREFLIKQVFRNNFLSAELVREKNKDSYCGGCLINVANNTANDYKCHYLLRKEKTPWPV